MSSENHPVPAPMDGRSGPHIAEADKKLNLENIPCQQTQPQNPVPLDIKVLIDGTR